MIGHPLPGGRAIRLLGEASAASLCANAASTRDIPRMRGGAQAHQRRCLDGYDIVKFQNHLQHPRILVQDAKLANYRMFSFQFSRADFTLPMN